MPIPNRNAGEGQSDFISRCMGDKVMNREYSDSKQRAAICYSQASKKDIAQEEVAKAAILLGIFCLTRDKDI